MAVDSTIHLGDLIIAGVSLIVLPFIRSLSTNLVQLRDTVRDLNSWVKLADKRLDRLESESQEQRDWLITIKDRRGSH